MNVTVEQQNLYTLTIGGTKHEGFKKVSEWEGLVKFQGPAGEVIAAEEKGKFDNFSSRSSQQKSLLRKLK